MPSRSARMLRMVAHCKIIWGDDKYHFESKRGGPFGGQHVFECFVRRAEEFGTPFGPILVYTNGWSSIEGAVNELEMMLAVMAEQVAGKIAEED